jgi:hypothetical protein
VVPRVPNDLILSFVTQFLVLRVLRSDELYSRGNMRALNLPNGLHTGQLTCTIHFGIGIFQCGTQGTQWHGTQFCDSVPSTACAEER